MSRKVRVGKGVARGEGGSGRRRKSVDRSQDIWQAMIICKILLLGAGTTKQTQGLSEFNTNSTWKHEWVLDADLRHLAKPNVSLEMLCK